MTLIIPCEEAKMNICSLKINKKAKIIHFCMTTVKHFNFDKPK